MSSGGGAVRAVESSRMMITARRRVVRVRCVLVTSLVALILGTLTVRPVGASSGETGLTPMRLQVECAGTRFPIGTPLVGDEVPNGPNLGEVKTIELIRVDDSPHAVGYLFTTRNGDLFVTDRQSSQALVWDYAVMNALVQAMGSILENAFDPRDNGFVYFRIVWKPQIATSLGLDRVPCPSKSG
jgi:hypothetical protein